MPVCFDNTASVWLLPEFLLLPTDLLGLGLQLPLPLLLLPGRPPELFKTVAGGAHQRGRRGLGPLSQTGPGAHVLQFGILEEEIRSISLQASKVWIKVWLFHTNLSLLGPNWSFRFLFQFDILLATGRCWRVWQATTSLRTFKQFHV